MKSWFAGLLMAVSLAFANGAEAASFNCRYAKAPAEVAICQSSYLENMDEQISRIYFGLRDDVSPREFASVKRAQSRFILRRNACGYNDSCLLRSQSERINQLCLFAEVRDINCSIY